MSTQVAFFEKWRDLMRSWGFTVHEAAGWRTRDAEPATFYRPGLMYLEHHDASTRLSGNWGALAYILNNRLANIVTARNGEITLCAAGVEWHAGVGSRASLGDIPKNGANPRSFGNEVCNDGISEPYSAALTRSIIAGEKAWTIVSGQKDVMRVLGHKEWADPEGRKSDPRADMDRRRADVQAFGNVVAVPPPVPSPGSPLKFPVGGAILAAYNRLGGVQRYGQPLGPEADAARGGRWQEFQRGAIYWHPNVDKGTAHAVEGDIRVHWWGLDAEWGPSGYPTTDERGDTGDGIGRFNHFENGWSIYWHPATGAHEVHGLIRDKWASLGWERSKLGYPTTGEVVQVDGSILQIFQRGGSITFSDKDGITVKLPA